MTFMYRQTVEPKYESTWLTETLHLNYGQTLLLQKYRCLFKAALQFICETRISVNFVLVVTVLHNVFTNNKANN